MTLKDITQKFVDFVTPKFQLPATPQPDFNQKFQEFSKRKDVAYDVSREVVRGLAADLYGHEVQLAKNVSDKFNKAYQNYDGFRDVVSSKYIQPIQQKFNKYIEDENTKLNNYNQSVKREKTMVMPGRLDTPEWVGKLNNWKPGGVPVGSVLSGLVSEDPSITQIRKKMYANIPLTQQERNLASSSMAMEVGGMSSPLATKGSALEQVASKVGKLNTSKLNLDKAGKTIVDTLESKVKPTVIGNKQVLEAAKKAIGSDKVITDAEMTKIMAGQFKNRQQVVTLTKNYQKAFTKLTPTERLEQLKAIAEKSRVAGSENTLAGRLLQSKKIIADAAAPMQKVFALLENAGVKSKTYLKDAVNVDFNDSRQVVGFYRKFVKPEFSEVLDEVRYSNMLSSPLTHLTNIFGNTIQTGIVTPIEKTISGTLGKLAGKEGYHPLQGADYVGGYFKSVPQAFTKAKNILTGKDIYFNPDMTRMPTAVSGPKFWYSTPLRALEAGDAFFSELVQGGEKTSLKRVGVTGKTAEKLAKDSAEYRLFRQAFGNEEQGGVLKLWDKWNTVMQKAQNAPGGRWIIPFIKTPTNILKAGIEFSPAGLATIPGAKKPIEQLSKALLGTAVFSGAYSLADQGLTTWDTPTNQKERELFYQAGYQPYSVKVGNNWVSYSKLGPMAYPVAMAAALKWAEQQNPDKNKVEQMAQGLGQMVGFFGDQSYLSNIGDFISAVQSGTPLTKSALDTQIASAVGQVIPYRAFQSWVARLIDPVYRKPDTIMERVTSQLPGLSKNVPAYQDMYGNNSTRDYPLLNAVSPLKVSRIKPTEEAAYQSMSSQKIQDAVNKRLLEGGTGTNNKYTQVKPTGGNQISQQFLDEQLKSDNETFVKNVFKLNLSRQQTEEMLAKKGITYQQAGNIIVKSLPVEDGSRGKAIIDALSKQQNPDLAAKQLAREKILTVAVVTQWENEGLINSDTADQMKAIIKEGITGKKTTKKPKVVAPIASLKASTPTLKRSAMPQAAMKRSSINMTPSISLYDLYRRRATR